MNRTPLILGIGAVVVLVLAVLAVRRGSTTNNVGDVGSKIVLPFGLGTQEASSAAASASKVVAAAASSTPTIAPVPGAFNRYGIKQLP